MNDIVSLIGSLGFPIVMCLLCFWLCYKMITEFSLQIKENTEAIKSLKEIIKGKENENEISSK